jgi:bacterioferritin (cytochrome b1)
MNRAAISILNSLLIDELAATESYKIASQKGCVVAVKQELSELGLGHARRSARLISRVKELGGTPIRNTNKRIAIDSSSQTTEQSILAAFENAELLTLNSYSRSIGEIDSDSKLLLEELTCEQELAHNVVYTLRSCIEFLQKIA